MRRFSSPQNRLSMLKFLLFVSALFIFFFSASTAAQAQYYLVDAKHDAARNAYQDAEYSDSYLSGISTAADDFAPAESNDCMAGAVNLFVTVAGACVGLPLLAMLAIRAILVRGVNSARMPFRSSECMLDAEISPLRWWDPHQKSLLETVRK